jgi:hypothetical protein
MIAAADQVDLPRGSCPAMPLTFWDQVVTIAGKLTVVGVLFAVIYAILRGMLVTGREYANVAARCASLEGAHKLYEAQITSLKNQNAAQQSAMEAQQRQIDTLNRELGEERRIRHQLRDELQEVRAERDLLRQEAAAAAAPRPAVKETAQ